jgi:hypothetical protein
VIGLTVRGVVPFGIPSTETEAPAGTLPIERTPPGFGAEAGVTAMYEILASVGIGVVVAAITGEKALIPWSVMPEAGPEKSPAKTGTGRTRRRNNMPIRRPEIILIFSPGVIQGTGKFRCYMPFACQVLSASFFIFLPAGTS